MRQLGIIASESERLVPNPKWYQFWKRKMNFEVIEMDDLQLELTIAYIADNPKMYNKCQDIARNLFLNQGIYNVIYTKKAKRDFEFGNEIRIHDGLEIAELMIPKIIAKIAKMNNYEVQQITVAWIGDNFYDESEKLLQNICQQCKYLILVTKNSEMASVISKGLLEEYGIPIEVVSNSNEKVDCDFAIYLNGNYPKLKDDTVIIDLRGRGEFTGKKTVHSIDLSIKESITKAIPYEFTNIEIYQALWKIGLFKETDWEKAKVKKIYFRKH